jgi:hypothetical protein
MLFEIKLNGVYWDILYYAGSAKKLREILTKDHPGKTIKILFRGKV